MAEPSKPQTKAVLPTTTKVDKVDQVDDKPKPVPSEPASSSSSAPAQDKPKATSSEPEKKESPKKDEKSPTKKDEKAPTKEDSKNDEQLTIVTYADKPLIDQETFNQILELDDDDDREFSKTMVWEYFDQAESTFDKIVKALDKKSLKELSDLGHFLKGSSAALGIVRVQGLCADIQHYGELRDERAGTPLDQDKALRLIALLLRQAKVDYEEAKAWFKNYYGET